VRQPKAFLFDEPLSNLDAKLRGQMRVEIRHLQRRLKTTSVYVTHDQLEAMTLADRLVVMNGGRIEQVGSPTDLFEKPRTRFVAGFIGSPPMNFIERSALPDAAALNGSLPAGTSTIGVRPEHVALAPEGPALALPVVVALIEPIGTESHVHLRWNDQQLVAAVRGRPMVKEGEQTTAHLQLAGLHPFDAGGQRVA
jgi:sn-glycerol 3-phosphate transport system ATP-binding protein